MQIFIIFVIAFFLVIWWVRPIYNFAARRKYQLLDLEKLTIMQRVQTWLPSIIFYGLIFGVLFYPAVTNNIVGGTEAGTILTVQILFLFILTRYDKRQTKYIIEAKGLRYRKKYIRWNQSYHIKFKKSFWIILHKPRFIMESSDTKIVIPMLSHRIKEFIDKISELDKKRGDFIREIYDNTRLYYIENPEIVKKLNKSN